MAPEVPQRTTIRGHPMSFFAVANLYTIEECSQYTRSVVSSDLQVEHGSSADDNFTALPRWDPIQSPRRVALSSVHTPRSAKSRPHTRHGSEDAMIEKSIPAKDTELGFASDRSGASTPAPEKEPPRHSRMMLWLILAFVTVLVLAIILGAVLGTFISPSRSSNAPDPSITDIPAGTTPTPTTNPGASPVPTSPPHLSSLAVTGWSVPGALGYHVVWIFSQRADGYLDRHTFNSSTGNWTRVTNFAKAKVGTPLAAASIDARYYLEQPNYMFPTMQYQTSVVYLDDNNYLNEWTFSDSGPATGQPGTLSGLKYIAREDTKLAYYWPRLTYQGLSGELREANFECHKTNACWHDRVLLTNAPLNGTSIATVPMANQLKATGLFYQAEDGQIVNYKAPDDREPELWANEAFSKKVPTRASITAFSTVRTGLTDESKLNTYLLWQDGNNTIQMSWTDDENGWTGPLTYQAFAGADNNTALTCLTGLTFGGFPLPSGTELARCYFQAGATVREVSFDGSGWDVVGNVPVEL